MKKNADKQALLDATSDGATGGGDETSTGERKRAAERSPPPSPSRVGVKKKKKNRLSFNAQPAAAKAKTDELENYLDHIKSFDWKDHVKVTGPHSWPTHGKVSHALCVCSPPT